MEKLLCSDEKFIDEYGNVFVAKKMLTPGGQGVVYTTDDPSWAIKQPLIDNKPDTSIDLKKTFQRIRILPIPADIQLTLPKSIIKNQPGYSMYMLNGMKPVESLFMSALQMKEILEQKIPDWLSVENNPQQAKWAAALVYYARTGGAKYRYEILYLCASILARLHHNGLVYCDISLNNVFVGEKEGVTDVWLIDTDNLRFERFEGGNSPYTPRFGAPEIVQDARDASRPRSDSYSFAILAFWILRGVHPFLGEATEDDDWENEGMSNEEKAFAGYFPYIDDEEDDSNCCMNNDIPKTIVFTPEVDDLFQQTLGAGRLEPYKRVSMGVWARVMAKTHDLLISCPCCNMSYSPQEHNACPVCDASRPKVLVVESPYWKMFLQKGNSNIYRIPNRVAQPFSLKNGNDTCFELEVNFETQKIKPALESAIPDSVQCHFMED